MYYEKLQTLIYMNNIHQIGQVMLESIKKRASAAPFHGYTTAGFLAKMACGALAYAKLGL